MAEWVEACAVDEIDHEDLIRFDHGGRVYAIYKSPEGAFYATDGICTHEHALLSDGLVIGDIIECPKHNGRFNYKTGVAKGAPVCVHLATHKVKVEDDAVFIEVA